MEKASKDKRSWSELKHEPAKRTDVSNLIRGILEKELKLPTNPHKTLVTLGLGTIRYYLMLIL